MVVGPCQHNYNEMHVRTHKIAIMVYAHLDFFLNCLPFQKNPLWMTTPKASKTSSLTRQVFWGLGVYNWLCWVQWSVVTQITLSRKLHKWCTNIRCVVKTCQGCTSHWLPILLQIKKTKLFHWFARSLLLSHGHPCTEVITKCNKTNSMQRLLQTAASL